MQFNYGYSKVSIVALIAALSRFEEGRWAAYKLVAPGKLSNKTDVFTVLKVLLVGRLSALAAANNPDTETLQDADARFDRAQRRYALELMKHQQSDDPADQAAADALAAETLSGSGFAQTSLTYAEEANFGKTQLERLASAALKPHIARLKLAPFIKDIAESVTELEESLGRDIASAGKTARSARVRDAHRAAAAAFDHAHGTLDDLAAQPISDDLRAEIAALLAPLNALLA